MKLIKLLTIIFVNLIFISSCATHGLVGKGGKKQKESPFVISRTSTSTPTQDVVWKKKTKNKTVNANGNHN